MNPIWAVVRRTLVAIRNQLLRRPFGLKTLGKGSSLLHPRHLEGRNFISIGSRSLTLGHSYIAAITQYGQLRYSPSISIGNDVYIGRHCYLTAMNEISIGDGCVLSEHVYITDLFHGTDPRKGLIMQQPIETKGPVRIGPNCFLGYRATVMPNVTLGEWCIVGANSVVTSSFPAYSMIAGAPARLIKVYSQELHQWVIPSSSSEGYELQ